MEVVMDASTLKAQLNQFCGTMEYTRWSFLFRKHCLTDGAKFLAEKAGAFWLMDAIASHHAKCMQDPMLQGIQFWTLKIKDGKGTLICERDSDDIAIKQEIPFTDFPLEEIKLYCQPLDATNYVIMLPSEY
jgi:hypothetical protein